MTYMLRVTRAIMDPDYKDEEAFINEAAADFLRALETDPYKPRVSWMAEVNFYNRIFRHAKIPSVRILSEWPIAYHANNRFFWEFAEIMFETQGVEYMPSS